MIDIWLMIIGSVVTLIWVIALAFLIFGDYLDSKPPD